MKSILNMTVLDLIKAIAREEQPPRDGRILTFCPSPPCFERARLRAAEAEVRTAQTKALRVQVEKVQLETHVEQLQRQVAALTVPPAPPAPAQAPSEPWRYDIVRGLIGETFSHDEVEWLVAQNVGDFITVCCHQFGDSLIVDRRRLARWLESVGGSAHLRSLLPDEPMCDADRAVWPHCERFGIWTCPDFVPAVAVLDAHFNPRMSYPLPKRDINPVLSLAKQRERDAVQAKQRQAAAKAVQESENLAAREARDAQSNTVN